VSRPFKFKNLISKNRKKVAILKTSLLLYSIEHTKATEISYKFIFISINLFIFSSCYFLRNNLILLSQGYYYTNYPL
jgi:hypothetical protein